MIAPQYILKEISIVAIGIFVVLLAISLGGRFTGYLDEAAQGRIGADVLIQLVWLRVPDFASLVLPLSIYLALLVVMNRLTSEQEMSVLSLGGLSMSRFMISIGVFVLLLSVGLAWVVHFHAPAARAQVAEIMFEEKVVDEFAQLQPRVFNELGDRRRILFFDHRDIREPQLHGVQIVDVTVDNPIWIEAETAKIYEHESSALRYFSLAHGTILQGTPGETRLVKTEFGEASIKLDYQSRLDTGIQASLKPTHRLDISDPAAMTELQWRIAIPVLCLVSTLCALGIGYAKPRTSRFSRLFPGLAVFVSYYLILLFGRNLLDQNPDLGLIGFWPVHFVFVGIAVFYLRRAWWPAP